MTKGVNGLVVLSCNVFTMLALAIKRKPWEQVCTVQCYALLAALQSLLLPACLLTSRPTSSLSANQPGCQYSLAPPPQPHSPPTHHALQEVVCDINSTQGVALNVLTNLLSSPAGT